MTQIVSLIVLVIFVAVTCFIGVASTKKANTLDGFLLGGRNIGAWLSAFAYGTSYFSAVIFIGYAGKHGWDIGLASIWIGIGNAIIGSTIAWILLAKKTRRMTISLSARTMPEMFAGRYNSKGMKIYSALIIFIFLVPYAASVYKGLGSLFSTIFPVFGDNGTVICMAIVAVFTAVYLVLGGYVATAVNSLVQGILMLAGVILMVVGIINNPAVGGLANGIEALKAESPSLVSVFGGSNFNFLAVNILLTSFGVWGLPQMVHKFSALKNEKNIPQATIISTIFAIIIGCGAYLAGSFGRFFIPTLENGQPECGFDYVVPEMLTKAFGTDIGGSILIAILLVCVLSASMSTLSSVVLTSASSITVDLIPTVRKTPIKANRQMLLTRGLCLAFVLLSFIFATSNFAVIVSIMAYSWGIVAGCFLGPYIWGLYWKKTTKAGAWAGMISGVAVVAIMVIYGIITSPVLETDGLYAAFQAVSTNSPTFGCVAMAVSVVIVPLVSLFTKKPDSEVVERAFSVPVE